MILLTPIKVSLRDLLKFVLVESRLFIFTIPEQWMNSVSPIYIPTWVALGLPRREEPKNNRSPCFRESGSVSLLILNLIPYWNCCDASRERIIPFRK